MYEIEFSDNENSHSLHSNHHQTRRKSRSSQIKSTHHNQYNDVRYRNNLHIESQKRENGICGSCCFSWEFLVKIILLVVLCVELCSVFIPLQDSRDYILTKYNEKPLYKIGESSTGKSNSQSWRTSISTWSICNKDVFYFNDEEGFAEVNIYFLNGIIDQHVLIGNMYSLILSIPVGFKNTYNYYCINSPNLSSESELDQLKSTKEIVNDLKSEPQFLYATENEIYYDVALLNELQKAKEQKEKVMENKIFVNEALCTSLRKVYMYCILSLVLGVINLTALFLLTRGSIATYRQYIYYRKRVKYISNDSHHHRIQRDSSSSCCSNLFSLLFFFSILFTILLQSAIGFGACLQYYEYLKHLELFYSKKYEDTQFNITFYVCDGWVIFFASSCTLFLFSIYKLVISLCTLDYNRLENEFKIIIRNQFILCRKIIYNSVILFNRIKVFCCCKDHKKSRHHKNIFEDEIPEESILDQPRREIELPMKKRSNDELKQENL